VRKDSLPTKRQNNLVTKESSTSRRRNKIPVLNYNSKCQNPTSNLFSKVLTVNKQVDYCFFGFFLAFLGSASSLLLVVGLFFKVILPPGGDCSRTAKINPTKVR